MKQIFLGPELRLFDSMAQNADELARYEARGASVTEAAFDDSHEDTRRGLIAVGLGAALVIILLLVTASDIARTGARGRAPRGARGRARVTDDVLLTLSLLLMGALLARFIASLIRIPEILVLVAFGAAVRAVRARRRRRARSTRSARSSCSRWASR